MQYIQPAQLPQITLPEVRQLDIASPINAYYQAKQNAQQNDYKQQTLDIARQNQEAEAEMTKLKLAEYKAGEAGRQLKAKADAIALDESYMEWGKKKLAMLNPDSETFQQDLAEVMHEMGQQLVERKMTPPEAEVMVKRFYTSPAATPEGIKALQTKMGLREKDDTKTQISDGQVITVKDGKAVAAPIEGFVKKPTDTSSPATDIDDYVNRANKQAIAETGKPLSFGEQNRAALEFKRAQAAEVGDVTMAKRTAESSTAERIKYNEELGKNLALLLR